VKTEDVFCDSAIGSATLRRFAPDPTHSLRAWDSADLYLCQHVAENALLENLPTLIICNDDCGALTTLFAKAADKNSSLFSINDSFIGRRATLANLAHNSDRSNTTLCSDVPAELPKPQLVVIKVPKSNALLIDQLHQLRPHLAADTTILAGVMARHLAPSVISTFESIVGPTSSSRAVKKARILEIKYDEQLIPAANPYPTSYNVAELSGPVRQAAAVFSQGKLDAGSRFLLEHLPELHAQMQIIDLGCGDGVLGLCAMQRCATAKLTFVDESSAAIASSQENAARLFPDRNAQFLNQDCLDPKPSTNADLILCNPPFHTGRALDTSTAERMFTQSHACLERGGKLYVVCNRHLDYAKRLRRVFGHHKMIAEDRRFQVLYAQKR